MLFTIVVGGCGLVLLWQLIKPEPNPVNGVYRQPGRWYLLKKFIFKLILKLNQRKNKRKKVDDGDSYQTRGYGKGITDHHRLEDVQVLEKDSFAIDSVYYGAFAKDGTRLALRIGRRHNRQSEMWFALEIPGIGRLQHPLHPDTLFSNVADREYSAGGLKIENIESMKKWKVSYNGQLRFDNTTKLVHTQLSLIWTAATDPFSFDTDMNQSALADAVAREKWTRKFWKSLRSTHQTHYEQWGELRGKIKVNGFEEKSVTMMSMRDHSFGVRDWRSFYRYAIHFIFLENGAMIQTGVVSSPATMSHVKIGYVMYASGVTHSVSDIDLKLWQVAEDSGPSNKYRFNFYAGGKKFCTEVSGEWTPIWYHHEDRGSKVYEKFCKYKINGVNGYGLVEFHYRHPDGIPYQPTESLPLLEEPSLETIPDQLQNLTLTFRDKGCCSSQLVGGKGAQLGLLTSIQDQVGAVVPDGFCVTLTAFTKQLQTNKEINESVDRLISSLRSGDDKNLQRICSDTVELLSSAPVCPPVADDILLRLKSTFKDYDKVYLAVRSSASGEDGTEASSAGQMETYLGVRGQKEVIDAVRKCWASAFTYQAVQYRRMNGQSIKVCVGVVIQEMVQSEVSGVLFTNNPVTGSANQITINASYGLGEAVVSGKTTPDTIMVDRSWDSKLTIAEKTLGDKKVTMAVKEGGGLTEHNIENQEKYCMADDQLLQLCEKAILVEYYFGSPRDIEWAISAGKFYLLQIKLFVCGS